MNAKPSPIIGLGVSLIVGLALGLIGGPVQILGAWAIAGLLIGAMSNGFKPAALNGAAFGFVLSYVFMIHGYNGTDPIATRLLPFVLLGLFGAICGLGLAVIGVTPTIFRRRKASNKTLNS
jgi:hypothetical protein